MGLESTTTIAGLVSTNPVASDALGQADDHLRLIKTVLKTIFPGSGGSGFSIPITASEAELNHVDGVTSPIQTQLNTISGNATTALANAATADGKAVTADGKAVAAQSDATTALANAATADGKAVAAQADATAALAMGADAWCIFNGNTGAIKKSHNIASVVRNGTGDYTVTFTNNMPATDYAVVCTGSSAFAVCMLSSRLVGSFDIGCFTTFTAAVYTDTTEVHMAVFAAA